MDFEKFQKKFISYITQDVLLEDLDIILYPGGELNLNEAIDVYKIDYQSRMKEALGANFEATWTILGDENFYELAQSYIKKFPSKSTNLTNYGDYFPEFLLENDCEDYVCEMALFEKKYWEYFHRSDVLPMELNEEVLSQFDFTLENITLIKSSLDLDLVWKNREFGLAAIDEDLLFCDSYYALYRSADKVDVLSLSHSLIYELLCELKVKKKISNLNERFSTLTPPDWALIMQVLKFN